MQDKLGGMVEKRDSQHYRVMPPVSRVAHAIFSPALAAALKRVLGPVRATLPRIGAPVSAEPPLALVVRGGAGVLPEPLAAALVEPDAFRPSLAALVTQTGFETVREPGYEDRLFLFPGVLVCAYDDAREVLEADPGTPGADGQVPGLPRTHAQVASIVAQADVVLEPVLAELSRLMTDEQRGVTITLAARP